MTCSTVEEKIYRKQIYKGGLFRSATEHKEQIRYFSQQDLRELFSIPKQGFDVSLTQEQLHEEHGSEYQMDPSLKVHMEFLDSLGIVGISDHSLLFSKAAPVPVVEEEEQTYVEFVFKPKDVVHKKSLFPSISNKLTESEINHQINRLSRLYANKAMMSKLDDKGEKIQKQIAHLKSELHKLGVMKTGERETIDVDTGQ